MSECEIQCCANCGDEHLTVNLHEYDQHYYCQECYSDCFSACEHCGNIVRNDDIRFADDTYFCVDCFVDECDRCDHCGEYHTNVNLHCDDNNTTICAQCYEQYYYHCEQCGNIVHVDDAISNDYGIYCRDCYDWDADNGDDSEYIHGYGYKPQARFYQTPGESTKRYFGTEVEIDHGSDRSELADELNNYDEIYLKEDGSLSESGIEIVSHPCTLQYHMNVLDWKGIFEDCKQYGYSSHDAKTCGLHIHISKDAFGSTPWEIDGNLAKLLYIVHKHWDKVIAFSRRTESQLNQWAAKYSCIDYGCDTIQDALKKAKEYNDISRYVAINLRNQNTVEIRVFRGTLNLQTFYAALQFCDILVDLSLKPVDVVQRATWSDIKIYGEKYKEFTEYCKARGI